VAQRERTRAENGKADIPGSWLVRKVSRSAIVVSRSISC